MHSAMPSDAPESVAKNLRVLVLYDGPLARHPPNHPDSNRSPASAIQIEKQILGSTSPRAGAGFVRKMIALYRALPPYELPDAFRTRLHQSLAERWMEKQGSGDVRDHVKPARSSIRHALSPAAWTAVKVRHSLGQR